MAVRRDERIGERGRARSSVGIFDRLAPGVTPPNPVASLAADLSALLNSRVSLLPPDPKRSALIDRSVLCYGVPDTASVVVFGPRAVSWLRSEIQRAVMNFEPRLRQVKVSVLEQDVKKRTLAFRIEAIFDDLRLGYDATFTSRSSKFEVDRADPRVRVSEPGGRGGRR